LECLVAVADSGSITQAAQVLYSSQPAVSHQIAVLERETGTALLRREPRGVRLTPAGRAAVPEARRAIEAAASAVRTARAVGRAAGGTLRLACAQSLVSVLAPVVREWLHGRPEVAITLRESTSPSDLHGLLESDEADVVVMPGAVPDRFTGTLVAHEEVVLVSSVDHPLARRPHVQLQDVDGACFVHYTADNGLSAWLDRALANAGVRPEPVMRTSVTSAAPQLAASGLGVAVCPISAVSDGFQGAVRSFSPRWTRQLMAVTVAEPDPLVARFIDDLRSHGIPVPQAVRAQLAHDEQPPTVAPERTPAAALVPAAL